jgi:hypothetical protein
LKAVFEEGNHPTYDYDFIKRHLAIFEVSVPGEGHKDVGYGQQCDRPHGAMISFQCFGG